MNLGLIVWGTSPVGMSNIDQSSLQCRPSNSNIAQPFHFSLKIYYSWYHSLRVSTWDECNCQNLDDDVITHHRNRKYDRNKPLALTNFLNPLYNDILSTLSLLKETCNSENFIYFYIYPELTMSSKGETKQQEERNSTGRKISYWWLTLPVGLSTTTGISNASSHKVIQCIHLIHSIS